MAFITRYCRIRNNEIFVGGEAIYRQEPGDIDSFLEDAMKSMSVNYPKFYKMDRLSKLGFLAAEILLKGSEIIRHHGPQSLAIVMSNAHASLDTDVRYFESTRTIASPALFVYTLTNIVMGEICIRHGIKGENAFFVTPAFDTELVASYVDSILAAPKTSACIAGWIDVMGNDHDVFLYLAENTTGDVDAISHHPEQLKELYRR